MSIDQRLAELGITLPQPAAPVAAYVPAVEAGGLLHISGQISFAEDGSLIKGRLGEDVDLDGGIAAARRCGIMLLAQIKAALGSLDRVERIVKLGVFVNSAPSFTDQPKVANGASELMQEVFGEAGPPCAQRRRRCRAPARSRGRGRRDRRGEGLVHPRLATHLSGMADRETEFVAKIASGVSRRSMLARGTGWPAATRSSATHSSRRSKIRAASGRAPAGRPRRS